MRSASLFMKKHKKTSKILALLLSVALCLSLFPVSVFAYSQNEEVYLDFSSTDANTSFDIEIRTNTGSRGRWEVVGALKSYKPTSELTKLTITKTVSQSEISIAILVNDNADTFHNWTLTADDKTGTYYKGSDQTRTAVNDHTENVTYSAYTSANDGRYIIDVVIKGDSVPSDFKIIAEFAKDQSLHVLEVTSNGNGDVEKKDEGDDIYHLAAIPNPDYYLDYWEYRGASTGGEWVAAGDSYGQTSYTVTISEDCEYRAVFAPSKLVLAGEPWLYPIPGIYAPLGVRGVNERTDVEGGTYYTLFSMNYNDGLPDADTPAAGASAALYVRYDVLGSLLLNQEAKIGVKDGGGVDLSYPSAGGGHYIGLALYAGDAAAGEPLISYEDTVLLASGSYAVDYIAVTKGGGVEFQFLMPETEYLTARIRLDDQEPLLVTVPTGQSAELTALSHEFRTLENLRWRYLIDHTLQKATTAMRDAETPGQQAAVAAAARNDIEGYLNGTNKDYITVSFDGNIVRVRDKDVQQIAMMAALEQQYPRELGYWYLDGFSSGAFGLWVNGFGGRMFTENELRAGTLETDIKTPKHEFKAGEALPVSGILIGPQSGTLTYGVNKFFANFGISTWRCSDGDQFAWGAGDMLSDDDGIPDWDEPGGEVWRLAADFTGDANVIAALELCTALTNDSAVEQIAAARAAYKAVPAAFWNPAYAQSLFRSYEPYKAAYDKLVALEKGAGVVDPLPDIRAEEALAGVLAYLESSVTEPAFNNEWAVLALARGGVTPDAGYYEGYYSNVAEYVTGKGTGKLHDSQSTVNSRLILALSALGKDAANVGGHDLTAPFADHDWVVGQGINGAIYALLALDTHDYAIPNVDSISSPATREGLIEHILEAKVEGGWSLGGGAPDVDVTAMALQALAPYYHKVASDDEHPLTIAVLNTLDWLKTRQKANGGFASGFSGADDISTCSTAQVVTALTALGIPLTYEEYGWTKDGAWNPVVALLANYNEAGWFGESGNTLRNDMATEQAAYALVAYSRFVNSQPRLYDMNDAFIAPGPAQDNADISAAKDIVEAAAYTVAQSDIADEAAALAKVNAIIDGLELNGVTAAVTTVSYTEAVAGTADNESGTNGVYAFTVALNKGAGTEQVTDELMLTITAAAYSEPGASVQATVSIQLGDSGLELAKQGFTVEADLSETYGYGDAYGGERATPLDALVAAHIAMFSDEELNDWLEVDNGGVMKKIMGVDFFNSYFFINGAIPGSDTVTTALLADNDDLLFYLLQTEDYLDAVAWFTDGDGAPLDAITVEEDEEFTVTLVGYIAMFAFYGDVADYTEPIEDAQVVILDIDEAAGIRYALFDTELGLTDEDGRLDIIFDEPGYYILSAYDDSGYDMPFTAPWLAVTVTAEDPAQDSADIAAAKTLVEGAFASTAAAQAEANSEAAALAKVNAVIGGLDLNGVTAEVTKVDYTEAIAGTAENESGINGVYTFTVALNKGAGTEQITDGLTLTITATAYTASTSAAVTFRLIGDAEHGLTDAPQYTEWIPAREVTLTGTGTFYVYDAFTKALNEAGLTASMTNNNNYVESITRNGFTLAEFGNGSSFSGWKYFVNGAYSSVGLKDRAVNDGDVIVWHYINDYLAEEIAWAQSYPDIPVLSGISVKAPPTKTVYEAGGQLSLSGLTITADYGGVTADISYNAALPRFGASPAHNDLLNTEGTIPVTVTYQGRTAVFDITVGDSAEQLLAARADKISLIEAVTDGLSEADYTAASWAALQAAIADAKAQVQNAATVGEVNAVSVPATNGLVTLASELAAAKEAKIAAANAVTDGLEASDYTFESWAALQEAISDAIQAVAGAETLSEVNDVRIPSTSGLVPAADEIEAAKAAKTMAINAVTNGLTESDYTSESWAELQAAISEAIQAVAGAETIGEVNAVQIPSTNGLVSLASLLAAARADKIAEISAVTSGLTEADYTAASWAELQAALMNAIAEVQNAATVDEVNVVSVPATDGLVALADEAARLLAAAKADKIAEINAVTSGLTASNYTEDSWNALQTEIANAIQAVEGAAAISEVNAVSLPTAGNLVLKQPSSGTAEYSGALTKALAYLRSSVPSPGFGTSGGEWTILALARGGYTETSYYDGYYSRVLAETAGNTKLDENKPTENARLVIALTALGLDATDIEGSDYVTPLTDMDWVSRQGINGNIFALIALDTKNYLPGTTVRQTLIDAILEAEISGGGWSLSGGTPDPDLTGMALQALAPYKGRTDVNAAINRAAVWLDANTITDSEGLSQVIVAYSALGIDAAAYVTRLLDGYYDEATGGFKRGGAVNAMATDQAAYALVAYDRFKTNNSNALYNMSDAARRVSDGVTPAVADKTALNEKIAEAEGINRGDYTDASWDRLQTVLTTAKTVTANANATQKAVDDAKNALTAAINGLKTPSSDGGDDSVRYATISVTDPGAHDGQTSVYYDSRRLEILDDETAFTLLQRTGLDIQYSGHPEYAGYYVKKINGFGEFDDGNKSGWMYSVNSVFPNYSSSLYYLENGDTVRWLYTRDVGQDVGGGEWENNSGGGTGSSNQTNETVSELETPLAVFPEQITEITVKAETTDGIATASVTADAINEAIKTAKKENNAAIAVTLTEAEKASGAEISIPKTPLNAIKEAGLDFVVKTQAGDIAFGQSALGTISAAGGNNVEISIKDLGRDEKIPKDNREYELALKIDGVAMRGLGGEIKVSLPYAGKVTDDAELLTVYRLADDGTYQEIKGAVYETSRGRALFTAQELGKFFVAEWISPFDDIQKSDWYYKAVRYTYSNGLIAGTAKDKFAPQTNLTRAMLITILAREAGVGASGGENWYSAAVEWGVANGITDGTNMEDNVTREQFAALLYRYAKFKGLDVSDTANLASYTDAEQVSEWAREAMGWANATGLITGRTASTLVPGGEATRAEAARILQMYVENIAGV
jgi:hypothetical protein